jgi:ectoine hydroxylase-related dioxygenase (phytanoyl-CoA dioxygenase family)
MSLKDKFEQLGYAVIPNVVDQQTIDLMREDHTDIIKDFDLKTLPQHLFLNKQSFIDNIVNKASKYLKTAFDQNSFVLYPNFTVRESIYLSFHNDSYFMKEDDEKNLDKPEFIQCAIYFQDNDENEGGGVTVVPETHLLSREDRKKITHNVNNGGSGRIVKSKSGDLVIWDARLIHSSTKPLSNPKEKKLALQWSVSRSDNYSDDFISYLSDRAKKKLHVSDFEAQRPLNFFIDMPNVSLNSFPEDIQESLLEQNIKFMGI